MSREKIIIAGASGHAKVVIDIFEKQGNCEIIGLLDQNKNTDEYFFDYKILGTEEDLPKIYLQYKECKFFIAIGDNWKRKLAYDKIKNYLPQAQFVSAIHPSANIARGVSIGKGTAIMAGVVINSNVSIGDFVIVNTNASLDHDCEMMNFSSIAPRAVTGGNVFIDEYAAISIGAVIINGIKVSKHAVIGAGTLLNKNCDANVVMYGVPAKTIRTREIGERYM